MVNLGNESINPISEGFKRCTKCGEIKATEEFHRQKGGANGRRSHCKTCQSEQIRHYYQENSERLKEQRRLYRQENPDYYRNWRQKNLKRRRDASRRWQQENPEKVREGKRRYRQENPEKMREKDRRRRARKAQLPAPVLANIEAILWDIQDGQCMYCGCDLADGYHVDHIVPLALADLLGDKHPGHVPSNLCLACEHCNTSKQNSLLEDWLSWKYPDQMDVILTRVDRHIALMKRWGGQGE